MRSWRWLRPAVGLLLLGALIAWLTPRALLGELQSLTPAWILAAIAVIAVATMIAALALFLLIGRDQALSFRRFIGAYWTAWGVGLVVPGQVGDLATLTLLLQRRGLHWPTSLGRSLLDKAISLVVLGGFAAVELRAWWPAIRPSAAGIAMILAGIAVVALVAWLAIRRAMCGNASGGRLVQGVCATAREMSESALQHPGRTAANFALTILKFALIVFAYWCVFRALGEEQLDYSRALPLVATSALVAYIPVSFNGLGTVELAGIALFGGIGIEKSAVLSAYLLLRVMVLAIAWLPLLAAAAFKRPHHPA